jgi:DNA-binding transcriptional ArsR family regulator
MSMNEELNQQLPNPRQARELGGTGEGEFDAAKAELFEAIGHPNRIKIIQELDQGPVGFAELKKRVGMESSGHLAFHLGKLRYLVALNSDGQYALTAEGKEALRMIQTVREKRSGQENRHTVVSRRALVAVLLVLIVALAAVATFQQLEIANRPQPHGTAVLNGKIYWYATVPLTSLPAKANVSITFGGVVFTLVPSQSPEFDIQLPSNFTVPVSSGATLQLSFNLTSATPVQPNSTVGGVGVTLTGIGGPYYGAVVKFADGTVEVMPNIAGTDAEGSAVHFFTASLPWFSTHGSPRAAVSENMTAVTLYVSI